MKKHQHDPYTYVPPSDINRVKDFSDGIFAFAATLLITLVNVPSVQRSHAEDLLPGLLLDYWRIYLVYAISFINISNYWTLHFNIFDNILQSDRQLIQLNTFLLLSVTFLPFPAKLMSRYGEIQIVALMYGITIATTYFFFMLLTGYAYSKNRLIRPEIHLPTKHLLFLKTVVPLLFALIGTCLSFLFPKLSFLFYFLVALSGFIPLRTLIKDLKIIPPNGTS